MRIFVYEYTCARADSPGGLRSEGRAMLTAALEDFGRIPGVATDTLFDVRDEEPVFRALARQADFTLVIAPEFDDLLEIRSRWVLEEGGRLLGSSPAGIRLAGDKLALASHWRAHGVLTPRTYALTSASSVPDVLFPVVCKPRVGAGSQVTFRAGDRAELEACIQQARAEGWGGELIVQPLVPGRPASAALILGAGGCLPLLPASQELSNDGRFHYRGGVIPLPEFLANRAVRLAQAAVAGVAGLCGYVGVDLILGDEADGSGDYAIEINPRLTTSYVGLRALAQTNLAELMLRAAADQPIQEPVWRERRLRFTPAGEVAFLS